MKALKALRDVVEMASVTEGPWEREESKLAVRQLRALLAVARAVPGLLATVQECSVFCGSCGYENPISGDEWPIDGQARLEKAYARLRRASAAAGRGERDG